MKYFYTFLLIALSCMMYGQSITGLWETYDDKTKKKKALVEIYKTDDLYFAKIVESYTSDSNAVCTECKGSKKGQPVIGLVIIENIKEDGSEYNGGKILDPENGKVYKCKISLASENKLEVRGFLGFSLLGRTQNWIRKEN